MEGTGGMVLPQFLSKSEQRSLARATIECPRYPIGGQDEQQSSIEVQGKVFKKNPAKFGVISLKPESPQGSYIFNIPHMWEKLRKKIEKYMPKHSEIDVLRKFDANFFFGVAYRQNDSFEMHTDRNRNSLDEEEWNPKNGWTLLVSIKRLDPACINRSSDLLFRGSHRGERLLQRPS